MAAPPTSESDDSIDRFLRRLTALRPGERALLRRHFDRRLAESPTALMLFYRIFPRRLPPWATEPHFFVATNAMRFPPELVGGQRNLGATLRAVITADNEPAITRQLQILLDADRDALYPRLTHTLGLLLSMRQPVNWRMLLTDIQAWGHPERYVQRRWAAAFHGHCFDTPPVLAATTTELSQ